MITDVWKINICQPTIIMLVSMHVLQKLLKKPDAQHWQEFLAEYSKIIFFPIRKFTDDKDEQMELYLFVCRSLIKDEFAKLKKFHTLSGSKKAKFTTWLVAVVRNLCIDWYRSKKGRFRLFKAIERLNDFDKKVFELIYLKNYSIQESFEIVRDSEKYEVNMSKFCGAIERIVNCLTKNNRQRLADLLLRSRERGIIQQFGLSRELFENLPQKSIEQPDVELNKKIINEILCELLNELSSEEKLLIRYWFESEFSAKKIAALMELESERVVYSKIRKLTRKLRERLAEKNITVQDLEKFNNISLF